MVSIEENGMGYRMCMFLHCDFKVSLNALSMILMLNTVCNTLSENYIEGYIVFGYRKLYIFQNKHSDIRVFLYWLGSAQRLK